MTPPRLGVELAAPGSDPGAWLGEATAYEAAGVDSLWVPGGGADPWVLLGALAAATWRVRLCVLAGGGFRPEAAATVGGLSGGRLVLARDGGEPGGLLVDAGGAVERWSRAAPPPGRPAWAEALATAAAADADGLLVPSSPGLLDLLLHPDEEDDRSDLQLTYG